MDVKVFRKYNFRTVFRNLPSAQAFSLFLTVESLHYRILVFQLSCHTISSKCLTILPYNCMYRYRHVFRSFSSAFFQFYCNLHSSQVWNATTIRFANDFVLCISFQLPVAFAAFFFTIYPPYQLRIFLVNSLLISTRNERRFSILVETIAISPAIINLPTRAPINFHFQNQIANDEDKTAGNAALVYGWRRGILQSLND